MSTAPIPWENIKLVVFDVDGTLYDQRIMRLRMLGELARDALDTRSLVALKVVRRYRLIREELGAQEVEGFDAVLAARTAEATGVHEAAVKAIVRDWLEQRPLAHILACRYPGVAELFAGLRRCGIVIAVFSDYPAADKLRAMELAADIVVCTADANIGVLKPNPRGLIAIMDAAKVGLGETLMIGDRIDRDGEAARRAGVPVLIRSSKPIPGWDTFAAFTDEVFAQVLEA